MIAVILQARLDSTRLPRKALLDLAGQPVIVRVMQNLKRVRADSYILACDFDSQSVLTPLAEACGFECIGGPKEDVLERFCLIIRRIGATTVLRATGDNPYIFIDAAEASLKRFASLSASDSRVDYFTYAGLPHGSGVEVFSADSLLASARLTDSPYDHEHVGPALYNHPDRFTCVSEPAPAPWFQPEMRTTIDTPDDYERACLIADRLSRTLELSRVSTTDILEAWRYVCNPLVFIPSTVPNQGTGHMRRLISLIGSLHSRWRCLLYVSASASIGVPEAPEYTLVHELPARSHLVIIDRFRSTPEEIDQWRTCGPVIALDEGGAGRGHADFLLDILPSLPSAHCQPNLANPAFLPLPVNRRQGSVDTIHNVLVVAGGNNYAGLARPCAVLLADFGYAVTVIDPEAEKPYTDPSGVMVSPILQNLREKLYLFDLVVTHYGFTAFEAMSAGCRVVLFSPSDYHYKLSIFQNISAIPPGPLSSKKLARAIAASHSFSRSISPTLEPLSLSDEISRLSARSVRPCPMCGDDRTLHTVARYPDRTVTRCPSCRMRYLSFLVSENQTYSRSYFFDEYRAQYGKTYLEDFDAIKDKGRLRMRVIDALSRQSFSGKAATEKKLLDIGCAFGPFLSAAAEMSWSVSGTDISDDAVRYVRDTLGFRAVVSAFPAPDLDNIFKSREFTAVTLWYVIEHFADLEPVLNRIRSLLQPGGVLAFATPSAAGVSGRFNTASFYRNSPGDHYTIWDPRDVRTQLARYGFKVQKIVSTGHHAERLPFTAFLKQGSWLWKVLNKVSELFSLGDTFEVYAIKQGSLEDIHD